MPDISNKIQRQSQKSENMSRKIIFLHRVFVSELEKIILIIKKKQKKDENGFHS